MISRSYSALTSSNSRIKPKTYRLCMPNLVKKSQLCYIPERCESFTSRSTEVIKLLLVVDIKFHEKSLRETVHVSELLIH